jgi:hypothetical protein
VDWEKSIEKALKESSSFVVIVTPASNDSDWVARETIRAEQLGKERIPVLLSGELPLRLLNVQYIDFRGDFEGGFRDLLAALSRTDEVLLQTDQKVITLLGRAVQARLAGDFSTANSLIGQALLLNPDLSASAGDFWKHLSMTDAQHVENALRKLIDSGVQLIREESVLSRESIYPDGRPTIEWSVSIDADPAILDKIDYVKYQLHESFANPERIIRDRSSNFKLTILGWGTFWIPVEIFLKSGFSVETGYMLEFADVFG